MNFRSPVLITLSLFLFSCAKKTEVQDDRELASIIASTSKLYFEQDGALFAADLDGSAPQKYLTGFNPDPLPNTTKIAYTYYSPENNRYIAIYDIATQSNRVFSSITGDNNYGPVASPDGKQLAFNHFEGTNWAIAIVDTDDTNMTILTGLTGNYSPAWNRTSDAIFYQDMKGLYCVSTDTKHREKLLALDTLFKMKASASSAMRIATAENDRLIFFDVDADAKDNRYDYPWAAIYKFDTLSKTLDRITPDSVFAAAPFVSPNGMTIFFEGFESKDIKESGTDEEPLIDHFIYSMDLSGNNLKRICKGWRPTVR